MCPGTAGQSLIGNIAATRVADESTERQTNRQSDVQPGEKQDRINVRWRGRCLTRVDDRNGGLPIDVDPRKKLANRLRTAICALTLHNSSIQLDLGRATTAANRHRKTFFKKA